MDREKEIQATLLYPEEYWPACVDRHALKNLIAAVGRAMDSIAALDGPPCNLQVAIGLVPDRQAIVQVRALPSDSTDERIVKLKSLLAELRIPPVRQSPVAFALFRPLSGGAPDERFSTRPFVDLLGHGCGVPLDEILLRLAGLKPRSWVPPEHVPPGRPIPQPAVQQRAARQGWRQRLLQWWRRRKGVWKLGYEPSLPDPVTIESLTEQLGIYPDYLLFYRLRGRFYSESQRWDEAITDYDRVLAGAPDDLQALGERGECYLAQQRRASALADFNRLLQLAPHCVRALWYRAQLYAEIEAWEAAETDITVALQDEPFAAWLYAMRGRFRAARQLWDVAMQDTEEAVRLDPNMAEPYAVRGHIRLARLASLEELDLVERDFATACQIAPENEDYRLELVKVFLRGGKHNEALAACNELLSQNRALALAHGFRGSALHELGAAPAEVIAECSQAIESGAAPPAVFLHRAMAYLKTGAWHAGLDDCETVLSAGPDLVPAYVIRARLRIELERYDEAEADLDEAIRRAPEFSTAYAVRANCRRLLQRDEEALDDCRTAIEHDAKNCEAFFVRALCHEKQAAHEQAIVDLSHAVAIDPGVVELWVYRGKLRAACESYTLALDDLSRALQLSPGNEEALFYRANVLLNRGDYDAAIADFDAFIRLRPDLDLGYRGRGIAWLAKDRADLADQDFQQVVERTPGQFEELQLFRNLAEMTFWFQKERFDDVLNQATELMERLPDCIPAVERRAAANWYTGRLVEAIDDYSRIIELRPDSCTAYSGRGQARAELGEFAEALADLDKALSLADGDQHAVAQIAFIHNGRGLALTGLGRTGESSEEFEASIRDCPENAWAQFNLGWSYMKLKANDKAGTCFRLALELTGPRLPPRKRAGARAFLSRFAESSRESGEPDSSIREPV